jgi:hypothetical protein
VNGQDERGIDLALCYKSEPLTARLWASVHVPPGFLYELPNADPSTESDAFLSAGYHHSEFHLVGWPQKVIKGVLFWHFALSG